MLDVCCWTAVESEGLKLADAWFVESLTVINEEGKKWHCPCNQWLSLHHSDCQVYMHVQCHVRTFMFIQYLLILMQTTGVLLENYS